MLRRTKIVATLGPATDDPKILDKIIEAGVDVVRINFSHGSVEEHAERVKKVRNRARAHGRQVGVLCDLQGPKIRIERFKDGKKINLVEGQSFALDINVPSDAGTEEHVGLAYKSLPDDVKRGDTLLLDDGRIVLWVEEVEDGRINCKVVVGGILSDKKGINLQGGGLSAPALTEKDKQDIKTAAELKADYVALSFPLSADDVNNCRTLLR
ncbi:MAG: pyruvate kinase, partial [Gammaproteobacteria bacterium]|nr:pyruvate kinase [Gammaproteobacteria bacterium]